MADDIRDTGEDLPSWHKPDGMALGAWFEQTRIARFENRTYDWNALKFQADYDPKYRRAQMRYIGLGAAGAKSDAAVIPSEHFTFSTMALPAGCEGPMHVHDDVEEVFFMLRGKIRLFLEQDGEQAETVLNERDVVSVPPRIYRGLLNIGQEEALMCVMLGTPRPVLPTYPPNHPLAKLKRD
ncbi:MAG: cupin domain-containing protein [Alphaproteobacteria bacterium]|nr:cupin domain-containing protein [Alphaproteobacteria bacterium]